MLTRDSKSTQDSLTQSLVAYTVKTKMEKLIRKAERAGVLVVADADALAIRLIPSTEVKEDDDLRKLGIVVKVHNACGGGVSSVGSHPATHGCS